MYLKSSMDMYTMTMCIVNITLHVCLEFHCGVIAYNYNSVSQKIKSQDD